MKKNKKNKIPPLVTNQSHSLPICEIFHNVLSHFSTDFAFCYKEKAGDLVKNLNVLKGKMNFNL